ncbi:PROTEIN putative-RELATED [Salix koriyanagi]|uniref:PROTEIN putative-RELATED n=1 Tax=Salix koriyanagi TaxID=2511006 RepID=A0A9Q0UNL6_9ROSI|nr:PROTEIN putative-RELATED [Salix koriyanagi]
MPRSQSVKSPRPTTRRHVRLRLETVQAEHPKRRCPERYVRSSAKKRSTFCVCKACSSITLEGKLIIIVLFQTWYRSSEQEIILENGKLLDHVGTTEDATCKKRLSFCRKIDAITAGTNQPGSPEVKEKPIRTVSLTLSNSSPSQPDERSAAAPNTAARSRVTIKKPQKENDHQNKKKSDHPLIGMSIIIMTLVIMVVWGKLCAILCTSAWLYFVPRLRSEDTVSNGLISTESFYDSEDYKKRVVLDGFLERSHRSVS